MGLFGLWKGDGHTQPSLGDRVPFFGGWGEGHFIPLENGLQFPWWYFGIRPLPEPSMAEQRTLVMTTRGQPRCSLLGLRAACSWPLIFVKLLTPGDL